MRVRCIAPRAWFTCSDYNLFARRLEFMCIEARERSADQRATVSRRDQLARDRFDRLFAMLFRTLDRAFEFLSRLFAHARDLPWRPAAWLRSSRVCFNFSGWCRYMFPRCFYWNGSQVRVVFIKYFLSWLISDADESYNFYQEQQIIDGERIWAIDSTLILIHPVSKFLHR